MYVCINDSIASGSVKCSATDEVQFTVLLSSHRMHNDGADYLAGTNKGLIETKYLNLVETLITRKLLE